MRERLNQVGPGFCAAKWTQVTLHLHNGHTHSCHHPDTHQVGLDEIAIDPSALHNSRYKKDQRRTMLSGGRPEECDYCWRIEDCGSENLSDRVFKSAASWSRDQLDQIAKADWNANVDPTYLEVSFSSVCNMACSYCAPHISSAWLKEIRKFGGYPTYGRTNDLKPLLERGRLPLEGENPYVEAFWRWWPTLYPKLRVLRVTGGEPLLSQDVFRVMDHILREARPELEFGLNTNLMVPKDRLDKFIEQAREILDAKKIRKFAVYTSIDAWGPRAEYIRHGLRHDYFWKNVQRVLEALPEAEFVFMCTFNALSVTSFRPLLEHVSRLKANFPRVVFDISYLRFPEHLSAKILTVNYLPYLASHLRFMETAKFHENELAKMRRLHAWLTQTESESWLSDFRRDFYVFFQEHDRRRGTSFLASFPEMQDFWRQCEFLASSHWLKTETPPC